MTALKDALELKNGTVLKNRICKASTSEAMATPDGRITAQHIKLYDTWCKGGSGLLITGNVMVDGRHMNEPLVVDGLHDQNYTALRKWAATAKAHDAHIWPQLSHPGKQSPKMVNDQPLSPSEVPIENDMFIPPKMLNEEQILDIVERFGSVAERCEKAGFSGVQLHGAHGYLISQFLSPHHNRRTDRWGGSFENRLGFVEEVYKNIRGRTTEAFNVAIKINSSDFQKGGFTEEDSIRTAKVLDEMGFDLIEISGGSWENPVNRTGKSPDLGVKESTRKREAYFLEYAEKVRREISTPLMVTGGFRSTQGMEDALSSGAIDIVGLARPFAVDTNFANNALADKNYCSTVAPISTGVKKIDNAAIMEISWYTMQLKRISLGLEPRQRARGLLSVAEVLFNFWRNGRAVRRVRAS